MTMGNRHTTKHRSADGVRLDLRLSVQERDKIRADAEARMTEDGDPLTMSEWVRDRLGLEPAPRLWVTFQEQKAWPRAASWVEAKDNGDGTLTTVDGRTEKWGPRQPHAFVASVPPSAEAIRYAGSAELPELPASA